MAAGAGRRRRAGGGGKGGSSCLMRTYAPEDQVKVDVICHRRRVELRRQGRDVELGVPCEVGAGRVAPRRAHTEPGVAEWRTAVPFPVPAAATTMAMTTITAVLVLPLQHLSQGRWRGQCGRDVAGQGHSGRWWRNGCRVRCVAVRLWKATEVESTQATEVDTHAHRHSRRGGPCTATQHEGRSRRKERGGHTCLNLLLENRPPVA